MVADEARYRRAIKNATAAGDDAAVKRLTTALEAHLAKPAPSSSDVVTQGMSGVNEGVADLAGAPVDLTTMALNAGIGGLNILTGADVGRIENPVGGSGTFRDLLAPTISDTPPQTGAQRYARAVGREAGQMAIPVMGALGKAAKPAETVAAALLSAGGAGVAGQAAEDIAPDQPVVRALAELAGGGGAVGAKYAARKGPQAPTMDDLRQWQDEAYKVVDNSPTTVTQASRDRLMRQMEHRYDAEGGDELLHPKATRALGKTDEKMPPMPALSEIEKKRRFIGRDVAGAADDGERKIGKALKDEIDDYLDNLGQGDVVGPDAEDVVSALHEGRDLTRRIKKAEQVTDGDVSAAERAKRRAATSGTGGNEVNAIRQNVRAILDSPTKRRGYSPDEIKAMEELVYGTPSINAMRLLGRMSPTSGALSLYSNIGAVGVGGPVAGPLAFAPAIIGTTAKAGSEAATSRQVDALSDLIRNGGPLPQKTMTEAEGRVLRALLASQAATAASP